MAATPDPLSGRHDDDLELARRCSGGDVEAQRAFVDRFASLVYSVCAHSGLTGPDREDVSQQVMLDVFRALPRYRGVSRLSTWIYSLALRRVADHFRSPHRREVPLGSPGDETFPPSPPTATILAPEEQAVRREEDWRMSQAVARLAQPERAVILAYYLGEMPVAEIARALKIPEGTVKTRLHRGRRMLRKELGVP
jgi:RNA polymerase sigma-70 factor, ECF subfamily